MAKAIMISDEVYKELKNLKSDRSFSELLKDLLNPDKVKKGSGLRTCLGIIKEDRGWEEVSKGIKRGWKDWSRRYV